MSTIYFFFLPFLPFGAICLSVNAYVPIKPKYKAIAKRMTAYGTLATNYSKVAIRPEVDL